MPKTMKIIFTMDDGLKSHLKFYDATGARATYFILPNYTEQAVPDGLFWERLCDWHEVKKLADKGEIGFHGHSAVSYNKWTDEKINQKMREGMELFKNRVGCVPQSFAYTDMNPGRPDLIRQYCPNIRDYFWRDGKVTDYLKPEGEYTFRMEEKQLPDNFIPYREKIFVIRPSRNIYYFMKRLKYLETQYEYVVIILHKLDDDLLKVCSLASSFWECITFGEIFQCE